MAHMTGATIIVRLLERQGVDIVAGIPGGANLPLYDALGASSIHHVLARHEQGAGFIAQGLARATGRPGVVLATSGPGATNTITALADARLDSVPLVCLTGQAPRSLLGGDAFQEVDAYGLSLPVTKHGYLARSAAELLEIIPEAFRLAVSGRPGPVLVDIPRDVQTETAEVANWPEPGRADPAPRPDPEALALAAALVNGSERPLFYLGGGVVRSGGAEAARALAEAADIPAVLTLQALGAMPRGGPLCPGMLGMHGDPAANLALAECDLLIAVGARFDDRATGRLETFCPDAAVAHIDIDPGELHKHRTAQAAIRADAGEALAALAPLIRPRRRPEWLARLAALTAATRRPEPAPDPRTPRGLIMAVAGMLDPDVFVVADVGQNQMWTATTYPFARPGRWLTSGGLGTMGFGLPVGIGAALSGPGRSAVVFCGDGGLLMNIQELATAVEERAEALVVVMDNGGLGLVRQQQELLMAGRTVASTFAARVDYARVAEGFGLPAFDLGRTADPLDMLGQAVSGRGPRLVRAPLDAGLGAFPMVPPGAANIDMLMGGKDERMRA